MLHRRSISVQSHCSISELNLLDRPIFHDHPIDIPDAKWRYHFSIIDLWYSAIKDLSKEIWRKNEQISGFFFAKYRSGLLVKKICATTDLSAFACSSSKISKGSYMSERSYVSADSCCLVFFPFLIFLMKNELLIRGFSCVVQIDFMCLKMWSKHAVVKCNARASYLTTSF